MSQDRRIESQIRTMRWQVVSHLWRVRLTHSLRNRHWF